MSRAQQLTTLAYDTINSILADPKAPAGVRLKAALEVLKLAESDPEEDQEPATTPPGTTIRHTHPKIGRNETCPCGSNLKFKRCCLNKPAQPLARAA